MAEQSTNRDSEWDLAAKILKSIPALSSNPASTFPTPANGDELYDLAKKILDSMPLI